MSIDVKLNLVIHSFLEVWSIYAVQENEHQRAADPDCSVNIYLSHPVDSLEAGKAIDSVAGLEDDKDQYVVTLAIRESPCIQ